MRYVPQQQVNGLAVAVLLTLAGGAWAQSSSLFVRPVTSSPARTPATGTVASGARGEPVLSPIIASASLAAIRPAEPRFFQLHDLVTIIVRESTQADAAATLDTEKNVNVDGAVTAFPNLSPAELLKLSLEAGTFSKNGNPELGVEYKNKYKGDGSYNRQDTLTARLTAEVVDIKPNGSLVLEGRKFLKNDKETLTLTLTGTCQPGDVSVDNTVLSTQLFDLRVTAAHTGELRKATKKGIITKALEWIFNF
jgi:flagellar L-ring protein FlgH